MRGPCCISPPFSSLVFLPAGLWLARALSLSLLSFFLSFFLSLSRFVVLTFSIFCFRFLSLSLSVHGWVDWVRRFFGHFPGTTMWGVTCNHCKAMQVILCAREFTLRRCATLIPSSHLNAPPKSPIETQNVCISTVSLYISIYICIYIYGCELCIY